jgi:hypothetical protein
MPGSALMRTTVIVYVIRLPASVELLAAPARVAAQVHEHVVQHLVSGLDAT